MTMPLQEGREVQQGSQEIFKGSILRLRLDEVRCPDGHHRKREIVEHPGGVLALAELPNGKLLLIRQFRYALNDFLIEFPAGKREPNESPLVSIQRELEEETGYLADHWEELTHIVTSPGFCDEVVYLYKATGLSLSPNPRREEDECIEVIEATPDEIRTMIANRTIIDAKTICAFYRAYGG